MARMNRRTALIGLGTIVFGTSGFIASGAFDIGSQGSAGQGWVQVDGTTEDVEPDDDDEADVDAADEEDGEDADEADTDGETDPTDQDEMDTDEGENEDEDGDEEDSDPDIFTLTHTAEGGGSISVSADQSSEGSTAGAVRYTEGTEVTLSASPDEGYEFVRWEGDVPGSIADDDEITLTMDRHRSVTAVFERTEFALTVQVAGEGDGIVTIDDTTVTPGGSFERVYEADEAVTLSADPGEEAVFAGWSGDLEGGSSEDLSVTVTMDQDRTVIATFGELYSLFASVEGDGGGTVTVSGPAPDIDSADSDVVSDGTVTSGEQVEFRYEPGSEVDLTAAPGDGSRLIEWAGDVPDGVTVDRSEPESGLEISVTMDRSRSIAAIFEEVFTLTVDLEGDGAVNVSAPEDAESGSVSGPDSTWEATYVSGTELSLGADPAEGFGLLGWTGDIPDSFADAETVPIVMDRDRSVTAVFAELVELAVTVEGPGSVSFDGTTTTDSATRAFLPDTNVTLTAEPDEGFALREWTGDLGNASQDTASITLTMNRNRDVTAVFTEEILELTRVQAIVDPDDDGNLLNTGSLSWSGRMSDSEFVASDDNGLFAGFSVGNANRNAVSRIGIVDDQGYPVDRFAFLVVNAGDPDQPGTGGQPVEIETTIYDADGNPIGSTDQLNLPYRVTNGTAGTDLLADRVSLDVTDVIEVAIEIDARYGTEDVERVATLGFSVRRSD